MTTEKSTFQGGGLDTSTTPVRRVHRLLVLPIEVSHVAAALLKPARSIALLRTLEP